MSVLTEQNTANRFARAAEQFANETRDHEMTVLHDEGVYRHIRFQRPKSGIWHFDLVTWPGHLSITGDVGGYTFARAHDMIDFFGQSPQINPGYWGEKLVAHSGYKSYSQELFRREVTQAFDEVKDDLANPAHVWAQIEDRVLESEEYEPEAREAVDSFTCGRFSFVDTFEWNLTDFDHHYLLCCHAILFGVRRYAALTAVTS